MRELSAAIPFWKRPPLLIRRLSNSGEASIDGDHLFQSADTVTSKGRNRLDQPGFRQEISSRPRQIMPWLTQPNDDEVAALQVSPFKPIKPDRNTLAEIKDVARHNDGTDEECRDSRNGE
ncbi:hypothetical protein [Rhodomicrobium sp. R_RK_3]|uniref:hypothetical protein n=1 Tax=Rhodomicrobium sp. R_RK_3 TaxID=2029567 RepID=UPI001FD9C5AA|nr:hypothetical protein [Rhodomicrobium sp. R_RK_3]